MCEGAAQRRLGVGMGCFGDPGHFDKEWAVDSHVASNLPPHAEGPAQSQALGLVAVYHTVNTSVGRHGGQASVQVRCWLREQLACCVWFCVIRRMCTSPLAASRLLVHRQRSDQGNPKERPGSVNGRA